MLSIKKSCTYEDENWKFITYLLDSWEIHRYWFYVIFIDSAEMKYFQILYLTVILVLEMYLNRIVEKEWLNML